MKPLDIVKTPKGGLAIVVETNEMGDHVSIDFLLGQNPGVERNAWWCAYELELIDNIPRLLANAMCHPAGKGKSDVDYFFNNLDIDYEEQTQNT